MKNNYVFQNQKIKRDKSGTVLHVCQFNVWIARFSLLLCSVHCDMLFVLKPIRFQSSRRP